MNKRNPVVRAYRDLLAARLRLGRSCRLARPFAGPGSKPRPMLGLWEERNANGPGPYGYRP